MKIRVLILVWMFISACDLHTEATEFVFCDAPCGPCDFGRYDCDTDACELDDFSSVVLETDQCEVMVFGSESGTGDGTLSNPVGGLQPAIDLAAAKGAKVVVYMGNATGPIQIVDGVSVLGSRAEGFINRGNQTQVTAEFASDVENGVCFNAESIVAPTTIDGLSCLSTGGAHVLVGGRISASQNLTLKNSRFEAGDGRNGQDGVNGAVGADGQGGGLGGEEGARGVAGENSRCVEANGGQGGLGAVAGPQTLEAETGFDAPSGTQGGLVSSRGSSGLNGESGASGTRSMPVFTAGYFVPEVGQNGESGTFGTGGGGGGGGAASVSGSGGGGGGGGGGGASGGCGGGGGTAGENGASSIGMIVNTSSVTMVDVIAKAGNGGRGGVAGTGGDGGSPGRAGFGGGGSGDGEPGGDGGDGGRGGNGGTGSHGAGGHSLAVVECRSDYDETGLTVSFGVSGESPDGQGLSEDFWTCK